MQKLMNVSTKIYHCYFYMNAASSLLTYMQNCVVKLIYSMNYFSGLPCLCLFLHPLLKSPRDTS